MNDIDHSEQPLDPRLKGLLDLLRETPPRDPEAEARGRAKYLAEVDELFSEPTRPVASRLNTPVSATKRPGWRLDLGFLQHRLAFTTLMALLAIVLLVFGGAGATAFAAQGALPGDALYPLKTGLEATQLKLSIDAARQAQLHMDFAERRLDEIASLIADGRFDNIGTATSEFETHVQQAIDALETVSAGDPQRAKVLAMNISSALSRYSQVLRGMLTNVPETVKPVMEKAIQTSEEESHEVDLTGTIDSIAPDGIKINGQFVKVNSFTEIKGAMAVGAQVKVHALQGADGSLVASEIEVTAAAVEENANENENANVNVNENQADDNLNENQAGDNLNENQDENNTNLNENDNHDSNGNQNLNENDDEHDNDNTGSNQNFNENSNDNHENDNHNDNGGSNDNDNSHGNDNSGGGNNNNNNDD